MDTSNRKGYPLLEIRDLNTYYGPSHIIQGLCMDIAEGEAVSILGRNGVGKTTTLRSIMGLTPPASGKVLLNGKDITKWPPHKVSSSGVAYVPAERHIFPGLNVQENLRLAEQSSDRDECWTLESVYALFPVLAERAQQDGSTLSGGEQQMLAIGRALMSNPRIMILDEPSQGLSPLMVKAVTDVIVDFCGNTGLTILVVEQNYQMALKVASRHYLMETKGRIVRTATTKDLTEHPEIIQDHLSV